MGGRPRHFSGSTLVNGYIDDHGALLHQGQVLAADELRFRAGDQHTGDDSSLRVAARFHRSGGGLNNLDRIIKHGIEFNNAVGVGFRMDTRAPVPMAICAACAYRTTANDHNFCSLCTRHTTEQFSGTAIGRLQAVRTFWIASLSHVRHRRQQRKIFAIGAHDGFIGDGGDVGIGKRAGQFSIGCKVEISKEDQISRKY